MKPFFLVACCSLLSVFLMACGQEVQPEPAEPTVVGTAALLSKVESLSEFAGTPAADIPDLPTLSEEAIGRGQKVYSTYCVECHGENLEGEADWRLPNEDGSFRAPPHDDSGHTWHHGDKDLVDAIIKGGTRLPENLGGTSKMPAFGDVLTDQQISDVLAFIKSHWSEEIRAIQWEVSARK